MRVLMVLPAMDYPNRFPNFLPGCDFPSGYAYVAAALRAAGHEVYGLNPNNMLQYRTLPELVEHTLVDAIKTYEPELIAMGGLCTDFAYLRDASAIIRQRAPGVPIVLGGGIITNDEEFVFSTLRPDFSIHSEAEEVLVALANTIESGAHDYESVVNVGYWKDGKPQFTKKDFHYPDLDSRAFADYTPFDVDKMLDYYSFTARYLYRYTRPNPRPMTVVTARDCPFKCTFCIHGRNTVYREHSIAYIMEDLRRLYERYEFNILVILDELFAAKKKRLIEFCSAMIENRDKYGWDFEWIFQTHANAGLDRAALQLAKEAGCYSFSYGMESASPTVLKSMQKKSHPEQIAEAIQLTSEVKLGFGGNFIFGDPAETTDTINETLKFYRDHCLDIHLHFGTVSPYPGSKLYTDLVADGTLGDRLEYYENIITKSFNMTRIPETQWEAFKQQVAALNLFSLLRATKAVRVVERPLQLDHHSYAKEGTVLWEMWANCPHCGFLFAYPDCVIRRQAMTSGRNVITACPDCHKRVRVQVPADKVTGLTVPLERIDIAVSIDSVHDIARQCIGFLSRIVALVEEGRGDDAVTLYDAERRQYPKTTNLARIDRLVERVRAQRTRAKHEPAYQPRASLPIAAVT